MKPIAYALVLAVAGTGCQTLKPAPKTPDVRVCGDTSATTPHLTWTPATDVPAALQRSLPASSAVYVVPDAEADAFFAAIRKKEELTVHIPVPTGCTAFRASTSGTLNDALAEKYPDLVSAKGAAPTGDLRLDWDGKTFRGQVLSNSGTYLIEPKTSGGKTWYFVYSKQASTDRKQPFEQSNRAVPVDR